MASALKPVKNGPAESSPRSTDTPAGEYIGRIVDTEIDAANANENCQQNREDKKIDFETERVMEAREQSTKGKISDCRKGCVAAGKARGEHTDGVRYKIRPRTLV